MPETQQLTEAKQPIGDSKSSLVGKLIASLVLWLIAYKLLPTAADWITYGLIGLQSNTHIASAVSFFVFEVPKVLLLLVLIVFVVGVIRTFFTPERTRQMLVGRRQIWGNILAAGLGVPTPFCSCSAVPLFIGFVQAGVPLGVTLSFLVAAPMVNEIALVMLFGLFGWKVAALYAITGLTIATFAGWLIGKLGMEKHVEEWVYEMQMAQVEQGDEKILWAQRIDMGTTAVKEIVGKVWPYILVGIAVGAGVHGYVPEGLMASVMGKDAWWSVPAAVLIGIPIYSNAAGIIPIVQALLEKGAALGTVLAFMMAVIGLSLPEMVILRKVLKPRLIGVFVCIMGLGITLVGYLFNHILI